MNFDITCVEFSGEIKDRASNLGKVDRRLLSAEILKVANAIDTSGFNLGLAQDMADYAKKGVPAADANDKILRCLEKEQVNQEILIEAGITDDTTANAWLSSIEPKLEAALVRLNQLKQEQASAVENFCKQWQVK